MIRFPPTGSIASSEKLITKQPVRIVERKREHDERLGGIRNSFRLSIDPFDLRRIVQEANRLGMKGKSVVGFAYDEAEEAIHIGPSAKENEQ